MPWPDRLEWLSGLIFSPRGLRFKRTEKGRGWKIENRLIGARLRPWHVRLIDWRFNCYPSWIIQVALTCSWTRHKLRPVDMNLEREEFEPCCAVSMPDGTNIVYQRDVCVMRGKPSTFGGLPMAAGGHLVRATISEWWPKLSIHLKSLTAYRIPFSDKQKSTSKD